MRNKLTIFLVLVILAIIIYILYGENKIEDTVNISDEIYTPELKERYSNKNIFSTEILNAPVLVDMDTPLKKDGDEFINRIDAELAILNEEVYFRNLGIETLAQTLPHRENVIPIAAIEMDAKKFQSLHVGNKIFLTISEEERYELPLKGVEPMEGSISLFADMESDGIEYSSVVTIGEDGSGYVHLSTPKGNYQIELVQGQGYIYKEQEIRRILSDESRSDVATVHRPKF